MIEKQIVFRSEYEECSIEKVSPSSGLEKIAVSTSPEIQRFIAENIESDPRYVYILVSALGSGEIWGPNVNGDYFREEDIKSSHKTFELFGHVFLHHQNKDPKNASGKILLSHWNPRMHRAELIIRIEREKAPKVARDIDEGKMPDVSMGCKVKFDVCSYCGNHAKTRAEYCTHLKNNMGKVLRDGRQVYAINPNPKFFDISIVFIGADRTAKGLAKIASVTKESDIEKQIPGMTLSADATHMASLLMEELGVMKDNEEDFDDELLEECAKHDLGDSLTTLMTLGLMLKPREFVRLLQIVSPPKDFRPFDGEVIHSIIPSAARYLYGRSAHRPYLLPRMIKTAVVRSKSVGGKDPYKNVERKSVFDKRKVAIPAIVGAHLLYDRYLHQLPDFQAKGLDATLKKHPALLPLVTAGALGSAWAFGARDNTNRDIMKPDSMEKQAANLGGRMLVGIPAAYLASNVAKRWEDDSKLARFLSKHPGLVAMLGISATNTSEDWEVIKKALSSFDKSGERFGKEAAAAISPNATVNDLLRDYNRLMSQETVKIAQKTADWQSEGAVALAALANLT